MEALAPDDVAILGLESDTIAGHTCKIVVVHGPAPSLDDIRGRFAERLDRVPRLGQRLSLDGKPAWVHDPEFSVDHHVRAGAAGDLTSVAARAMQGRLDRTHPLWDVELLDDAGQGTWALVWRVHHAIADGMTLMHWTSDLLWDEPPAEAPARKRSAPPGAPRTPLGLVTDTARTALSVARELRPLPERGPFDGRVGHRREVAFARCSLDDLRAIEHAAGRGVTVNDVVLTTVAGAIRRWCVQHGMAVGHARVKVPVSMHASAGDTVAAANRDSFLFVDLPLTEDDPHARLHAVNAETRERKTRHDAEAVFELLEVLERMAPPVARLATRVLQNPREFALNVSNVPGPRSEVRVLGRPVSALYSLAEVAPRHPLRVAAVSLNDSMQFGLCVDPDLVPGVRTLARGIEESVAELLPR